MKLTSLLGAGLVALACSIALVGCGSGGDSAASGSSAPSTPAPSGARVTGSFDIDGSNTVYPISAALVEDFNRTVGDAKVTVGKAGTGAGMEKFAKGEIAIAAASRPIKEDEIAALKEAGIEFIEIPIAFDGLCIVVSQKNTWLKSITVAELNKMWDEKSTAKTWREINPSWPNEPFKLYGPTSAHGTYEYFNEVINGDKKNTRQDYSQQAEYDGLVAGVGGDMNSLGYVGYAYAKTATELRSVAVDGGNGPVEPTDTTILDGSYQPLSRPLLMYVNKKMMEENAAIRAFVEFMISDAAKESVKTAEYIPLTDAAYTAIREYVKTGTAGSRMQGTKPGTPLEQLFVAKP